MTNSKLVKEVRKAVIALDAAQRQVFLQASRTDMRLGDLLKSGNQALSAQYYAALATVEALRAECRATGVNP